MLQEKREIETNTPISSYNFKPGLIIKVVEPYVKGPYASAYEKDQAKPGDVLFLRESVSGQGWKGTRLNGEGSAYISPLPSRYVDGYSRAQYQTHLRLAGIELKEATKLMEAAIQKDITGFINRGREEGLSTGSDPEMFVVDEHGVIIPAFDFLPAETSINKNSWTLTNQPFFDGFQAEWNILAGPCHANVGDALRAGLHNLWTKAKIHNPKATLTHESVLEIPQDIMERCTSKQTGLGCSPSLSAYDDEPLYIEDPTSLPIRFAGCHIHFQLQPEKKSKDEVIRRVKTIDRIAGPIMTSMLAGIEDPRRRQFYGKAGEFRMPAHGMEYRVPSSTALCHPIVAHLIFDLVRFAKQFAEKDYERLWKMPGGDEQAQDILNNYNIDEARHILRLNENILDKMITICYSVANGTTTAYAALSKEKFNKIKAIIMEGASEHLTYKTVARNWKLNPSQVWKAHCDSPNSCVVNMRVKPYNDEDD